MPVSESNAIGTIHQVLIVDGLKLPNHLPKTVETNTKAAMSLYPEAEYHLWGGEDLRTFLREKIGIEVLWAFDTLKPYSYKCDLARFCLLYHFGGLYLDLAVRLVHPWHIPHSSGIAAFTEMYPGMRSWTATQTSLLWSKPGRPEMQQSIEWIVENCRNRYYGPHDHYPTAGALLGRAFAAAMAANGQSDDADDQWMGECRYITPENKLQNLCYIAPDKTLVGMRMKLLAGDLTELGLVGTNSYVKIWRSKQAYGETERVWSHRDEMIVVEDRAERTQTGIKVTYGTVGRILYGPFFDLEPGNYRVSIKFTQDTMYAKIFIDISSEYGGQIIQDYFHSSETVERHSGVEFNFVADVMLAAVEFRMSVFGDFQGSIVSIKLISGSVQNWDFSHQDVGVIGGQKTMTGIEWPFGFAGRALYGPYADVGQGGQALTLKLAPDSTFSELLLEICANSGNLTLHSFTVGQSELNRDGEILIQFSLDRRYEDIEFRVELFGDFRGSLRGYSLAAAAGLPTPYATSIPVNTAAEAPGSTNEVTQRGAVVGLSRIGALLKKVGR